VIIDLHAHSIKSDDGRAKVQNYCQWIKAKNIAIDGDNPDWVDGILDIASDGAARLARQIPVVLVAKAVDSS